MPLEASGDIPIREFQTVLAKLGIFLHNYETGESFANELWKNFGYTEEDMADRNWLNLLHPDDREKAEDAMSSIIANETDKFDVIYRVRTVKGEYRWIYNSGIFLSRGKFGNPALFLGSDRDITALKESEQKLSEALRESRKKTLELETLQAAGKAVTSVLDLKQSVEIILEQVGKVVPYTLASVQLLKGNDLHCIGTRGWGDIAPPVISADSETPNGRVITEGKAQLVHDLTVRSHMEAACLHQEISSWIGVPLILKEKTLGLISCNLAGPGRFEEDHLRQAAGFADFIAIAINNARQHEQIYKMATIDPLTGVHNRRWFYENGIHLVHQAGRYDWPLTVMMLDLDDFKQVNDQYGHETGDAVLKESARIFQEGIRKSDMLCRYGGEEFCILLPQTDLQTARSIADRILIQIREMKIPELKMQQTVSIGMATRVPRGNLNLEKVIALADEALYRAKDRGKNCHFSH